MAWRRSMMVGFLTHICVTRPQWVNMWRVMIYYDSNKSLHMLYKASDNIWLIRNHVSPWWVNIMRTLSHHWMWVGREHWRWLLVPWESVGPPLTTMLTRLRNLVIWLTPWNHTSLSYVEGLMQDCSISSALAMEILQSCNKPSICPITAAVQVIL